MSFGDEDEPSIWSSPVASAADCVPTPLQPGDVLVPHDLECLNPLTTALTAVGVESE